MPEVTMSAATEEKFHTISRELWDLETQLEANAEQYSALQTSINECLAIEKSIKDQAYRKRNELMEVFDSRGSVTR